MTKFRIRVALLEALQKFCDSPDGTRPAMSCIRISATEMTATSGHRFAQVPIVGDGVDDRLVGVVDAPFLLPGLLVKHVAAAARATWEHIVEDEWGQEWAHSFDRNAECEVSVDGQRVTIEHGPIVSSMTTHDIADFPETAKLDKAMTREGTPCVARFNPRLFVGCRELLEITDDYYGVKLHAWDVFASGSGPTEFRSERGTRIVLMGMALPDERERAEKLHRAAMRGERPA